MLQKYKTHSHKHAYICKTQNKEQTTKKTPKKTHAYIHIHRKYTTSANVHGIPYYDVTDEYSKSAHNQDMHPQLTPTLQTNICIIKQSL